MKLLHIIFAVALAAFSLSFPQTSETLASQPRYIMSIFPLIVIYALWGKRPRFDQAFIAFSLPLLAINLDHAGMREPGNSTAKDEAAMARLYDKTLDIVNKKLAEKGLGKIEAASPKSLAKA